ncbi:MAG: sigma-70 family RNA polymerase sigma factor [Bacteroidetes bacterium]|nr:sigma-70 family RNA polymerase sigma factor [Bacteroidota bacterium]
MNLRNHQHTEDKDLLENFYKDGNNEWLGILLQRYTMLLLGVCMKYLKNEEEARDAVQQVFLKAIHELQKYKVEYIKSWLYMVAKNHCLMKLRDKGKYTLELNEQTLVTVSETADLKDLRQQDKRFDSMKAALENLNAEQKLCVTLFYLEKKSYQQVSELTGYSIMQVKSYIQNGKRNLKILMERDSTDE